jgi:hypothetical protein
MDGIAECGVPGRVLNAAAEDTSPTDITGGTPSPAAPVKSLFQTDAIGLKTTLSATWGLRAAGHCQY